jgi:hypothetical protein
MLSVKVHGDRIHRRGPTIARRTQAPTRTLYHVSAAAAGGLPVRAGFPQAITRVLRGANESDCFLGTVAKARSLAGRHRNGGRSRTGNLGGCAGVPPRPCANRGRAAKSLEAPFDLAIAWRVASQQCPPPFHQAKARLPQLAPLSKSSAPRPPAPHRNLANACNTRPGSHHNAEYSSLLSSDSPHG